MTSQDIWLPAIFGLLVAFSLNVAINLNRISNALQKPIEIRIVHSQTNTTEIQ